MVVKITVRLAPAIFVAGNLAIGKTGRPIFNVMQLFCVISISYKISEYCNDGC